MTLRTRIAAVAGISVALAVAAAAIGLYVAVRSDLRGEIDSKLRSRAQAFAAPGAGAANAPDADGAGGGRPPRGWGPPAEGEPPGGSGPGRRGGFPGRVEPAPFGAASGYVQFISPQGEVIVPGGQGAAPRQIALTAGDRAIAARGSGASFSERSVGGTKLRVLTAGTGANGAVLVAQPLTEVENELSRLLLILALIGASGVVLAALLGALVARTALAPIARFTRRTETLTGSLDLSRRLEVEGRDELARLADSFNATLDALERSVQAQRHLIADASHELRTPISSLRANIQVLGGRGAARARGAGEPARGHRGRAGRADGARRRRRGARPRRRARRRGRRSAAGRGRSRRRPPCRAPRGRAFRAEPRAHARARPGRAHRAGRLEPRGQRPQVEPRGGRGARWS